MVSRDEKISDWVAHSLARHFAGGPVIVEGLSWHKLFLEDELVEVGSSVVNAFSKLRLSIVPIDPDTEKLARKLAEATGKALPTVVREAIEAQAAAAGVWAQSGADHKPSDLFTRMMAITDGFGGLPVLDPRPADELLGYDEHGVPQ